MLGRAIETTMRPDRPSERPEDQRRLPTAAAGPGEVFASLLGFQVADAARRPQPLSGWSLAAEPASSRPPRPDSEPVTTSPPAAETVEPQNPEEDGDKEQLPTMPVAADTVYPNTPSPAGAAVPTEAPPPSPAEAEARSGAAIARSDGVSGAPVLPVSATTPPAPLPPTAAADLPTVAAPMATDATALPAMADLAVPTTAEPAVATDARQGPSSEQAGEAVDTAFDHRPAVTGLGGTDPMTRRGPGGVAATVPAAASTPAAVAPTTSLLVAPALVSTVAATPGTAVDSQPDLGETQPGLAGVESPVETGVDPVVPAAAGQPSPGGDDSGEHDSFAGTLANPGTTRAAAAGSDRSSPLGRTVSEQVAAHIVRGVKSGLGRVHIALEPEALGRLEIRLDFQRDGRIAAVILADNADTLKLLRQEAPSLEQSLANAGVKADSGSLSFGLRSDGGSAGTEQDRPQTAHRGPPDDDRSLDQTPAAAAAWQPASTGRLDIHA